VSGYLLKAPRVRVGLALLDGVLVAVAVWLAFAVRFSPGIRAARLAQLLDRPGFVALGIATLWAVAVAAELYEPAVIRRRLDLLIRVALAAVGWGGTLILATYLVPAWRFGRGLLLISATSWSLGAVLLRIVAARWLATRPRPRALVVGGAEATAAICESLARHPLAPWQGENGSGIPPTRVADEAVKRGAELVVLVGTEEMRTLLGDLATLQFSGIQVVAASEMWAWLDGRLPVAEMSPEAFLHQPGFGAIHWETFNRVTRVLDIMLGAAMAIVAIPVVLAAGLLILVVNGRPVIYGQERLGQYGRRFTILKLRTMRRDAEENGPAFASDDDVRVTRLGRVLRRFRLDELPQLFNVLRGEMSLVGPRPERPEFIAELAREIPYYTFRLALPPGLTGWSQINMPYARSIEEHRRKLEYDLYFIRERSLLLYTITLLRTVSAALLGTHR